VYFASSDDSAKPRARTVSFTVTDSFGAVSNVVSAAIDVTEVAPPAAYNVTATTGKNTAIDINVLGNDTDPSGLPLAVASEQDAGTTGVVTVNSDGTIRYNPNGKFGYLSPGQTAADTFSYAATDETRTSNSANVTVIITGVLPGSADTCGQAGVYPGAPGR
jgi:VCBS repeat-containing protein